MFVLLSLSPLLLSAALAQATAGEPVATLQFSAALTTDDLAERFRQAAEGQGLTGDEAEMACRELPEELRICLRFEEEGVRSWASRGLLREEGLTVEGAFERAAGRLDASPLQQAQVTDGEGVYWLSVAPDGLAELPLIRQEWLAGVGAAPVVAVPARGVLLAWDSSLEELNRIMMVGTRAIFAESDQAVSPKVLTPVGGLWRIYGEAVEGSDTPQ